MLLQLNINNIALIDKVSIELESGLNILTGETGAGKSIIIDSINAVLGDRVSRDIIRTGSEKALVEAVFKVDPEQIKEIMDEMGMEPEEDGTLILSREITQSGRNTCRINGKMVAASFIKLIGERIIDLHGQHDNQSLLKTDSHIELLDSFGGEAIRTIKQEYLSLLEQYKEVKVKLKELAGDPGERERKIDLLRFQIDEIRKAKLRPDEDEDLNKQRVMLANAEKISNSLSLAYSLITSGESGGKPAIDALNEALSHLSNVSQLDDTYNVLHKRLLDFIYQIDDLSDDLRSSFEDVENNPELLEEIVERLDLIYRLKRKYGASISEVNQYCESVEKQLAQIEANEESAALMESRKRELEEELHDAAFRLNTKRHEAASILEDRIGEQLEDLEMKKSRVHVDIRFDDELDASGERRFTQNGLDKIEFLISANVGEPLKPLARIASGGEMSRVMLAIKTILAQIDQIPSMIYDEIDNGISGLAAQKVGEKLSYISHGHQVICVTHLAQIASMAEHHYLIEKVMEENSTRTIVKKLRDRENIKEIARLIGGGEASSASLKYAEEMIDKAKKIRQA